MGFLTGKRLSSPFSKGKGGIRGTISRVNIPSSPFVKRGTEGDFEANEESEHIGKAFDMNLA